MSQRDQIPTESPQIRNGLTRFFSNQPDFNIRQASVLDAFKAPQAFNGIPDNVVPQVKTQLKNIQRVQALAPVPEAIPTLLNAGIKSAYQVSNLSQSQFKSLVGDQLGPEMAQQIHTHAVNSRINHELKMGSMLQMARGTGIKAIDGGLVGDQRAAKVQAILAESNVDYQQIFGSLNYCDCPDCATILSPAAYLVELLNFLRNNNLNPATPQTTGPTLLDKFLSRRPDIGRLELTCANTNTVLPYIDLSNEVMESFVRHLDEYLAANPPKQLPIEVYNVEDEDSSTLIAVPQNVDYHAYALVKEAVFPFSLPYNRPIDEIRVYLNYLGTSRQELIDVFRSAYQPGTCPEEAQLEQLNPTIINRTRDAETLGFLLEEYKIIFKEIFWPKQYFELTQGKTLTDAEYQTIIGVKSVAEYWGYEPNTNFTSGNGSLFYVADQFLPRSGITYVDLTNLVQTQFMNPYYPTGWSLTIYESLRYSYRFLQSLVDTTSTQPRKRFAKLILFLNTHMPLGYLYDKSKKDDHKLSLRLENATLVNGTGSTCTCNQHQDYSYWVYKYFEQIGKVVVLDSLDHGSLNIQGPVRVIPPTSGTSSPIPIIIGSLQQDGSIVDPNGKIVGNVLPDASVFLYNYNVFTIQILASDNVTPIAYGSSTQNLVRVNSETPVIWTPPQDTCDISKIALVHLDGTPLSELEYDRMMQFIRLRNRLGWTIDEVDKALDGLAVPPAPAPRTCCSEKQRKADAQLLSSVNDNGVDALGACPTHGQDKPFVPRIPVITSALVEQLVAIQNLLTLTALPLPQLLAFWADISTAGPTSLYVQLFLPHNIVGIDPVFKPDDNGNYLTASGLNLADHYPVLMAALQITSADDLTSIIQARNITPALTLANVSAIYRVALLARVIKTPISTFLEIIAFYGDPFTNAAVTLNALTTWNALQASGFSFGQLTFLFASVQNDPNDPLRPTLLDTLVTSKTIYDGIGAIELAHPDITVPSDILSTADTSGGVATVVGPDPTSNSDLAAKELGLIFDPTVVPGIIALLEGSTVYTTNVPPGLPINTDNLPSKVVYESVDPGILQITGILTASEMASTKGVSSDPQWTAAIAKLAKQPCAFFNQTLTGIFPDPNSLETAKAAILAGDVPAVATQTDGSGNQIPGTPGTAPTKRGVLLKYLEPFVRSFLGEQLIILTISNWGNLSPDLTQLFLESVLTSTTPTGQVQTAMDYLRTLDPAGKPPNTGPWNGYLVPPATYSYTFVSSVNPPGYVTINGIPYPFSIAQDDVYLTTAVALTAGTLYEFQVFPNLNTPLQWQSPRLARTQIPDTSLLPNFASDTMSQILTQFAKCTLVVNTLSLTADEINFWKQKIPFASISLNQLLRLGTYRNFASKISGAPASLLSLFSWAQMSSSDASTIAQKISDATSWKVDTITKLIASNHFNLGHLTDYTDELNLLTLQKAISISNKVGVDVNSLFDWAVPLTRFWTALRTSEAIQRSIRSRYSLSDYESLVTPLNNTIRENSKNALINYLLVQPEIKVANNITDADGLFEFFLIDVQMSSCLQTSRIKQAISTVQLYIQRCLLGLEPDVPPIDRDRWATMETQPLYVARKTVFLYPENWLDPSLRDDKTFLYQTLEGSLLQNDVTDQNTTDAMKNYLFSLDGIANLVGVGLYFDNQSATVHIFSRTRAPPYFYYYRTYSAQIWSPWEQMQIDIPSYNIDSANGKTIAVGTYLCPFIYNSRLFIAFPSIMQKVQPNPQSTGQNYTQFGTDTVGASAPIQYWETKLCWSEYRNGKWTQKQMTGGALYDDITVANYTLPDLSQYLFIPRIQTSNDGSTVSIDVFRNSGSVAVGRFDFINGNFVVGSSGATALTFAAATTAFEYNTNNEIHSWQAAIADPVYRTTVPYLQYPNGLNGASVQVYFNDPALGTTRQETFFHQFAHRLLGTVDNSNSLTKLFDFYTNLPDTQIPDSFGFDPSTNSYNELKTPYAIYNWELTFHAPMALVYQFRVSKQYDQALATLQTIFDPLLQSSGGQAFWKFRPFQQVAAKDYLELFFESLKPNTENASITEWRNNPFSPHVIARCVFSNLTNIRSRPVAYMKWVVMTYIQVLVEYGDYYFRQNTLESVPRAIQLYVMASHLFGPKPQPIPARGKIAPQTYLSLFNKWDAFDNAVVDLELAFPFSNEITIETGSADPVEIPNVFGFASTRYFAIPDNSQMRTLRDTIDDRLFKIRHCQDINGVLRSLALWEPPLDISQLVQASAAGLSIASVLNDLGAPLPNYRFMGLLDRALEIIQELKSLGDAFLSIKEKKDTEALSVLRAQQDSYIQNLYTGIRTSEIDAANRAIDALQQSRTGLVNKMTYYLTLTGDPLSSIPTPDADFTLIANSIDAPITSGRLMLSPGENEDLTKQGQAADIRLGVGIVETLVSVLHGLPTFAVHATPLGVGGKTEWGPPFVANATMAIARGISLAADQLQSQAATASITSALLRQLQERRQAANDAGNEIKNIDKQILAQQVRVNIANQELTLQQANLSNAKDIQDFLNNKYTNVALYTWMEAQVRTQYYNTYTLAYDLAKGAETAYHFERPLESDTSFIQYGYWDPSHDGLLCGDRLYYGLKQLGQAYRLKRGYDYEINKHVSLKRLDPLAWLNFRENGTCQFDVPEVIFDLDFPGHYNRRIKSVTLTIPCVVGPYTEVNCTLRLLKHRYRVSPLATSASDYIERTGEDDRFRTCIVPVDSIATSSGQNDGGVFELSFHDERYMPFEGAGVISTWELDLPVGYCQFDYSTITDVVMTLNYTSVDGGDKLKANASSIVGQFLDQHSEDRDLYNIFDLPNEFADQWENALHPPQGSPGVLDLKNLINLFPVYTLPAQRKSKLTITTLCSFISDNGSLQGLSLAPPSGTGANFGAATPIPGSDLFQYQTTTPLTLGAWKLLTGSVAPGATDRAWLLVRYWFTISK